MFFLNAAILAAASSASRLAIASGVLFFSRSFLSLMSSSMDFFFSIFAGDLDLLLLELAFLLLLRRLEGLLRLEGLRRLGGLRRREGLRRLRSGLLRRGVGLRRRLRGVGLRLLREGLRLRSLDRDLERPMAHQD